MLLAAARSIPFTHELSDAALILQLTIFGPPPDSILIAEVAALALPA